MPKFSELEEVHSAERKAASEKNQKRRLKTPNQVKALEKLYSGMDSSFSKFLPISHRLFHDHP